MANYFVLNTPSNLIEKIISTRYTPTDNKFTKFIPANPKSIDIYYKLLAKNPEVCVDFGDMLARSEFLFDHMKSAVLFSDEGRATPQKIRYREPESAPEIPSRQDTISSWLCSNPSADAYDLNDKFGLGMLAAKAYLERYHLTQ